MRRAYVNIDGDALDRERDADERTHGYGARPWEMDTERHDVDGLDSQRQPCSIWVRVSDSGTPGKYRFSVQCPCRGPGTGFHGSNEDSVKAKLREHVARSA